MTAHVAEPARTWDVSAGDPLEDIRRWAARMREDALRLPVRPRPFCTRVLMREEWLVPCTSGCELGVWTALETAGPNDRITAGEVAAVAAFACGRRVGEPEVLVVLRALIRDGMVEQGSVRRTGKATVLVYRLTPAGRRRAARMMA